MDESPRGYCLLINNFFTIGTYKEMQRFRNIFYQLHFEIDMQKNLKADELEKYLKNISRDEKLHGHNAFVLMILSSGNQNKEIYDSDDKVMNISTIVDIFNNNCPALKNKPKLFFFNCIRKGRLKAKFK
jgi:hypothetical protein